MLSLAVRPRLVAASQVQKRVEKREQKHKPCLAEMRFASCCCSTMCWFATGSAEAVGVQDLQLSYAESC